MSSNGTEDATVPSAEILKEMFDESLKKDPTKLGFTDEESTKFSKAFDDPEFRKMFGEYMEELSDPKHRAETEAYISQLEGEQRVPAGKELIRPAPGFVAKTHKLDEKAKDSKGDKLWMNIVVSDSVAKPSSVVSKEGESWSVPYSLGPPHMEKDNADVNVATFDCCFHPDALAMAKTRKAFQNLLVQTAMEGVEEAYKRQNQPTKLSKDFHIIKGVSYKSGVISTMMVDKSSKDSWSRPSEQSPAEQAAAAKIKNSLIGAASNSMASASSLAGKLAEQATGDKKPARSKEEVAAAVAAVKAKATQASATSTAAAAAAPKKKSEPLIKKGFLEGKGGSKSEPKPVKNALIQEISSTTTTTAPASPAKAKSPGKSSPKAKAAAAAAAAATAIAADVTPIETPSAIEEEAAALARLSAAEVESITHGAKAAAATKANSSPHKDRPVDSSLLAAINKEQADARSKGPIEPKYSVTERGIIEWGDFELSNPDGGDVTHGSAARSSRPKELVVRIELPRVGVGQTGQVELDVSEKRLSLKFKDVYAVSFSLPYRVDDKKGSAKFEKVSQALVVTLPVAKPSAEELATQVPPKRVLQDIETTTSDSKDAEKDKGLRRSPRTPTKASISHTSAEDVTAAKIAAAASPKAKKVTASNPYLSSVSAEEAKAAKDLKDEIAQAAAAAKEQAEKDAKDPVKAAEKDSKREAALKAENDAKAQREALANAPADTSVMFLASETFTGRKNGYVFKRSDAGLGYHLDVPSGVSPAVAAAAVVVAAPVVSHASAEETKKENSSVPIVPPFEHRQTAHAVSVLIDLSGIDSASVQAFFDTSSARCSFTAGNQSYAFELIVPEAKRNQHKLDSQQCKYDVAKKNMVIVLFKDASSKFIWEAADGSAMILESRPWAALSPIKAAKQPVATSTSPSSIDTLIKQAQNMKFSSTSAEALFDLD